MSACVGNYDRQYALLTSPVGRPGSGAMRYGAAMYFYNHHALSAETLEIYRRCCILDQEEPVELAQFEGLDLSPLLLKTL
jgi:hypothetical protein